MNEPCPTCGAVKLDPGLFKRLETPEGACDLCREVHPEDDMDRKMRPNVCKWCRIQGGQLGIGSRSGSKKNVLRMLAEVHKPKLWGHRTYSIHAGEFGREWQAKGATMGTFRFGFLQLPDGITKKNEFVNGRIACNTYDCEMYPKPKFVEIEGKTCIQLHPDNLLDKWKDESFLWQYGARDISVLLEPKRKVRR